MKSPTKLPMQSPMQPLAAFVVVMAACAAHAQPVVTRYDIDGKTSLKFSAPDCTANTKQRLFLEIQATEPAYELRFVEYPNSGSTSAGV